MKQNGLHIKRYLFTAILLGFVVIALQQQLKFKFEYPLAGAVTLSEKPEFSFKTWFDDSFQTQYQKYVNEHFGFRNSFVRLNNQLAFTFFNKAKANGVIIGKENYLYEENYIKAYYGLDSISNDSIAERLAKFKFVQDTLKKLNIDLLLIYAPGKASYLPEFIPKNKKPKQKHQTNYARFVAQSKISGIRFIDFHDYFEKQKATILYPLYPKFGIHWSAYASTLVIDSLIHYIEKLKGVDLNNMTYNGIIYSDSVSDADYDMGNGINVLFKMQSNKLAYANVSYENNPDKPKPDILAISDSYWWSIYNMDLLANVFGKSDFWFYNKQVFPEKSGKPTFTKQLHLKSELENHSIIILMATDATLPQLGWGFVEQAYAIYNPN